jgi:hypothetical protein
MMTPLRGCDLLQALFLFEPSDCRGYNTISYPRFSMRARDAGRCPAGLVPELNSVSRNISDYITPYRDILSS